MRKRVTYRPSKSGSVMGGVVGVIFVLIGLFVVIPSFSMTGGFGAIFGVLWTIIAGVIAGTNFYQAFGKGYIGPEIHIEEEGGTEHAQDAAAPGDTQARLTELRALYDQRLITQEEYEQKRKEILEEL
ncbi:SHOCT domain-containing protein [Intestinimonas timonensis]|uniref:SHOCT domain-containing protein n=1 Tax=Intestinimonas timonensis TaxID=1689270 RepID=UPI001030530F|nr:SHOCT domain-containing protein [Intestinimonas timonensis]